MPQPINGLGTTNPAFQPITQGSDIENIGVDVDFVASTKEKYKDKYLSQPRKAATTLKMGSFTEHGIYMDTSKINLDNYSLPQLKELLWYLQKDVRDANEDLVTMGRRWDNASFFDKYPFGWVDYLVAKGYVEGKIEEIQAYIPTVENKIRQMEAPTKALAVEMPVKQLAHVNLSDEALQKISELKSEKGNLANELSKLKSELEGANWYQTPLIYAQIAFKGIEIFNIDNAIAMWEKGGPTVKPT